ncbi:MAG TPA: hypothetical protein VL091_15025 [Marinobacter sp.]|nr:hypothetical protein [Marinobacter sp.]
MLRVVLITGFIVLMFSAVMFGPDLLKEGTITTETITRQECNLLAGQCEWHRNTGKWQVTLSIETGVDQPQEYLLKVITTEAPDRFLAVLRGESMYMGEYPIPLAQTASNSGIYVARFNAPVCSTGGDMIWRVDLQNGQSAIEHIPMKMVFKANH